jgi:hypothetical protein
VSQDDYHDMPSLDEGETEELESGDTPEESESEDAPNPFREISEEEMEEGKYLGEATDAEDDESGTDSEEV